MYTTTPISMFMSGPKNAKNGILTLQTFGATDLKQGMHAQFDLRVTWSGTFLATLLPNGL